MAEKRDHHSRIDDGGGSLTPSDPKHPILAVSLIALTQLLIVMDGSIVTIALPSIGEDLDVGDSLLAWSLTGYILAFGALLLPGGRLGDLFGYRRMLIVGLLGFSVASLVGGVASTYGLLVLARIAQGVSAALLAPAALALVSTTFSEGPSRHRAFAIYAAMSGAGAGVGLLIGGALTGADNLLGIAMSGWRLTFLINIPIAVVIAVLARRAFSETGRARQRLDVPGAITAALGVSAMAYGLTRVGEVSGVDAVAGLSLAIGAVLLGAFVIVERASKAPLLPLEIITEPRRVATLLVLAAAIGAQFAMFYLLTLFLQRVLLYDPLAAGLAFLPMSVGVVLGAAAGSRLLRTAVGRWVAPVGLALSAVALFMLSRLDVEAPLDEVERWAVGGIGAEIDYWTQVLPFVGLMAVGMGAALTSLTPKAMEGVSPAVAGAASGLVNTVQQVGGAFGIAMATTLGTLATASARLEAEGTIGSEPGVDAERVDALVDLATFSPAMSVAFTIGAAALLLAGITAAVLERRSTAFGRARTSR